MPRVAMPTPYPCPPEVMIVALIGMVVVTAMTGMGKGFAATINLSASEL